MPLYYVEEQTMSCKKDSEYYEKRVSKMRKYFKEKQ